MPKFIEKSKHAQWTFSIQLMFRKHSGMSFKELQEEEGEGEEDINKQLPELRFFLKYRIVL